MQTHMFPTHRFGHLCVRRRPTAITFAPRFGFSEIAARGIWLAIKGGAVVGALVGAVLAAAFDAIFGAVTGGILGAIVGFLSAVFLAPIVAVWLVSPWSRRHSVPTTALVSGLGAGVLTAVAFGFLAGRFAAVPALFAAWGSHRLTLVSAARPPAASCSSPVA